MLCAWSAVSAVLLTMHVPTAVCLQCNPSVTIAAMLKARACNKSQTSAMCILQDTPACGSGTSLYVTSSATESLETLVRNLGSNLLFGLEVLTGWGVAEGAVSFACWVEGGVSMMQGTMNVNARRIPSSAGAFLVVMGRSLWLGGFAYLVVKLGIAVAFRWC